MTINMNSALRGSGLNATYKGFPARILPITADVLQEHADANGKNPGKVLVAGDVVVSWQEDGHRRGEVIDLMGNNDLAIALRKSNGKDEFVEAGNISDAIATLTVLMVNDRVRRDLLPGINEAGALKHATAVDRGEAEGAYEPKLPKFIDNAFANVGVLIGAANARLGAEYANPFTGAAGQSIAALGELQVTNAVRNVLTEGEKSKVAEARELRAKIAELQANKARPADVVAEVDFEARADRMQAAKEAMNLRGDGPSVAQMSAVMANHELMKLAMLPFTSTPLCQIQTIRPGPRDANAVLHSLRNTEDTGWGAAAIGHARTLLQDKMKSYDFKAKLFSRDGVDTLVVADQAGPAIYMWDSATRVIGFNPADHLTNLTLADVSTDEEIKELREQVRDLEFDNGGEIDFGFGEAEEEVRDLTI